MEIAQMILYATITDPPFDDGACHYSEILESTGVTVVARLKLIGAVGTVPATTSAKIPEA